MTPGLVRSWIVKGTLIAILLSAGWLFHRVTLQPDPSRLRTFAEDALVEIFGPDVRHGAVSVDVLDGVRIDNLRVQALGASEPGFSAERVVVHHDALALAAGVLTLRSVSIRGPKVSVHESADGGVAPDFPFTLPPAEGKGPPPSLFVERGTLRLVASEHSSTFRGGYALEMSDFHLTALPDEKGGLEIAGGFEMKGLGVPEADRTIALSGSANPSEGSLLVEATWPRLTLTPEIKAALSDSLRAQIEEKRLEAGPHRLTVRFKRDKGVEAGRLRVVPELHVTVRPEAIEGPLAKTVDAKTREQISDLLGKVDLTIEISGNKVEVKSLTSQVAGGEVRASGTVEDDGATLDLVVEAKGMRLDDPAFGKALGALGQTLTDEFRLSGRANATVKMKRTKGGPLAWDAAIDFVDATVAYVGKMDPVKKTPSGRPLWTGFPYAAEHVFGRVRLSPGSVVVDGLEGRHGLATIRLRSAAEKSRDGGETGFVRWAPDGPASARLTIEVEHVPVDADVKDAIERSEIAGFLDEYRLGGVVDRGVVDLVREAGRDDSPLAEVSLEVDGATLAFAPFPVPISDVKGRLLLTRPPLGTARRGRRIEVGAVGKASGGVVALKADLAQSERRGRIQVKVVNATIGDEVDRAVLEGEAGRGGFGDAWRFLHPFGRVDIAIDLPAYDDAGPPSYDVSLKEAGIHLRPEGPGGGARIEGVTGAIHVVGDRVEIANVTGSHRGAAIGVSGTMVGGPGGDWNLKVAGNAVPVTEGLLDVLSTASSTGRFLPKSVAVEPGGRLDMDLRLSRAPPPRGDGVLHAQVTATNVDLSARIGDLPVRFRGAFSASGDEVHLVGVTLEGTGLSLSVPDAVVGSKGFRGSGSARLKDLEVTPALADLLPASARGPFVDLTKDRLLDSDDLRADVAADGGLVLSGTLVAKAKPGAPQGGAPLGRLVFSPLTVSPPSPTSSGNGTLSGSIRLEGVTLDVGVAVSEVFGEAKIEELSLGDAPEGHGALWIATARIGGVVVTDVTAPLSWRESVLTAAPIAAAAYGGRVDATITIHTKAPEAFEGDATVSGVQIQGLLADVKAGSSTARGVLAADIDFQSRGGSSREVTAAGTASISAGDLGELPVVATVPALLAHMLPGIPRPRFHAASASFAVEDGSVRIDRVTLAGPLFRMSGFGTISFEGDVDFTFSPQFIKSLLFGGILQVPLVGDVLGLLREDPLYVVRVKGPISSATSKVEPFPFLARRRAPAPFTGTPPDGDPGRRVPPWFR